MGKGEMEQLTFELNHDSSSLLLHLRQGNLSRIPVILDQIVFQNLFFVQAMICPEVQSTYGVCCIGGKIFWISFDLENFNTCMLLLIIC
ncbi:hypothetical protein SOVF_153490 [Spinacia oleracea]|nr:hypothetical protein SOVF_153490 [Spinacia oleracea]